LKIRETNQVNNETIKQIVEEISPLLIGRVWGKIFQLSRTSIAIDFRPYVGGYLFINIEPSSMPRLYLIERRLKNLEKQSIPHQPFTLVLRKHFSDAKLISITKDENDRIVRFHFETQDEIGNKTERTLIAQLTGKAANLLLLDEKSFVIDSLRETFGEGQQIGERYSPPVAQNLKQQETPFQQQSHQTLSAALDDFYTQQEKEKSFNQHAKAIRSNLQSEIKRREKLLEKFNRDLSSHGDAERHKHIGDLLLANLSTATRNGNKVSLIDYFAEDAPQIEIEVDVNKTLQEEAAKRFARYAKAKRAAQEIARLKTETENELTPLREKLKRLDEVIAAKDFSALENFENKKTSQQQTRKKKSSKEFTGTRRYLSSDGFEIFVGKQSKDNDYLTFRVANSNDLWLHAADYPGSHVIIRNPNRKEIPQRTILEAAQLAAQYSQAKKETKAAVHYTEKKFVTKPKGAAAGLVRLSSFRTLIVEPKESCERV
jgi:predicted ribosome quality control (RQC) complex YloA/Tae2 family protein